jgi:ribosomal protein L29
MDFIKDAALRKFYMVDLEKVLEDYAPGRPEMKPDVIAQTLQLEKDRAKMAADAAAAGGGGQIILQQPGEAPVTLNNQQIVQIMQKLQTDLEARNNEIAQLQEANRELKEQLFHERLRGQAQAQASATATSTVPPLASVNPPSESEPETIIFV